MLFLASGASGLVLPYLRGIVESGLTPEEVASRLAAAGARVADEASPRATGSGARAARH